MSSMTLEERIKRAAKGIREFTAGMEVESKGDASPDTMIHSHELAKSALWHAFPELFASPPTHWLAPISLFVEPRNDA